MPAAAPLHETLLHGEPAEDRSEVRPRADRRWAYGLAGIVLVSGLLLYHLSVLLVSVGPSKGLAQAFAAGFLTNTHGYTYFRATRNDQSWAMFAPNPDRTNNFVKVFVTDARGEVWDFSQDIWGQDRYPYVFYDRRGKVNRNIDGKKHYQRIYGAWVCREWARQRGGEVPKSVQFIKHWTEVPAPELVLEAGGWDAWAAPTKTFVQDTITCASAEHGTLPNALRGRYGLAPIDEATGFHPVEIETWARSRGARSRENPGPG